MPRSSTWATANLSPWPASRRGAARRQGDRVRRQGLAVRERRRAVERLPGSRIAGRAPRDRIPVRCSRRTAASGSSTRTSSDRSRRTARGSRPACVRCRASPGTTTRCTSSMNNRDQLDAFWPDAFKPEDNAKRPAEPLYRAGAGFELRLAVLLLRLPAEEVPAQSRVRRRRQDGRPLQRVHAAGRGFPAHWAPVDLMFYTGTQFPAAVSRRRVHRLPRLVESRAGAGGIQRHVPADRERQGVRDVRGVRRRLHRQGDADQGAGRSGGAAGRRRRQGPTARSTSPKTSRERSGG